MITNRRSVSVLLVVGLGSGVVVTTVGCGSSPPAAATTPNSPDSHTGQSLASVIGCLNTHGMTVPSGATARQVESDFKALSGTQRQSVFNACESVMSTKVRQRISGRLAQAAATPTPSAS
jgi:hypothetical protein